MVLLKRCKKCQGDLYTESDRYGTYAACIQCGFIAKEESLPRVATATRHQPAAATRPGSVKRTMVG